MKKKRIKIKYSDIGLSKAFFAGTLSPGVVSVGNSNRATPERVQFLDTVMAERRVLNGEKLVLLRRFVCDDSYQAGNANWAVPNYIDPASVPKRENWQPKYHWWQHDDAGYGYSVNEPFLHEPLVRLEDGSTLVYVARIAPGSTPQDWRRDWLESLGILRDSIILRGSKKSLRSWSLKVFYRESTLANRVMRHFNLPLLTREELRMDEIEKRAAVYAFVQKAEGCYDPVPETPEFLREQAIAA